LLISSLATSTKHSKNRRQTFSFLRSTIITGKPTWSVPIHPMAGTANKKVTVVVSCSTWPKI
jgi:hypothetical protein